MQSLILSARTSSSSFAPCVAAFHIAAYHWLVAKPMPASARQPGRLEIALPRHRQRFSAQNRLSSPAYGFLPRDGATGSRPLLRTFPSGPIRLVFISQYLAGLGPVTGPAQAIRRHIEEQATWLIWLIAPQQRCCLCPRRRLVMTPCGHVSIRCRTKRQREDQGPGGGVPAWVAMQRGHARSSRTWSEAPTRRPWAPGRRCASELERLAAVGLRHPDGGPRRAGVGRDELPALQVRRGDRRDAQHDHGDQGQVFHEQVSRLLPRLAALCFVKFLGGRGDQLVYLRVGVARA